ncbi:unnamed protein product [Caenorhabditis brenneri]
MPSPMSYPNLQCIVQYLEANKRIELARRCPSIKTIEKLVPLRLEIFKMSDNVLRINETHYQLGVIQEFTDGRRFYGTNKIDGGWPDDLNEYGCEIATSNHILTPGDIGIPPIEHNENVINTEKQLEYLEKLDEELRNNRITDEETKKQCERISYSRRCQLNQEVPPCEMYILLTIHLPDDSKKFEAVKYDKKLYEAMKYLTTQIFGGRKHVVYVNTFDIFFPSSNDNFGFVLRLPESLKFKISRLKINNDVERVMNALSPILDCRSFPLKEIKVIVTEGSYLPPRDTRSKFQNPWNHEHPAVQSAECLYITTRWDECFPFALNARNPKVRLDTRFFLREDILGLIRKIVEEGWRQEIFYSFGIDDKEYLFAAVEELTESYDTWIEKDDEEGEKCFIRIHINTVTDLCIDFGPISEAIEPDEGDDDYDDNEDEIRWMLKLYTGERKDPGVVEKVAIAVHRARERFDDLKESFWDAMRCFRR